MDAAYFKSLFSFLVWTCLVTDPVSQAQDSGADTIPTSARQTLAPRLARWAVEPLRLAEQVVRTILRRPSPDQQQRDPAADEQPILEMPIAPPPPPSYQWTQRRHREFEYHSGSCI